ncbi:N-acetylneuraminate synthase [Chitinophaga lutea]
MKTYIIAEAGVNHNGSLDMALELIIRAKEAGADCVKFQTFKASQIVTQTSPKAAYQLEVTDKAESQYQMLEKLELSYEGYEALIAKCKEIDIDFLSTPYNKEDVDFLDGLGVSGFKVASGQLVELPFLRYVASKGKLVILSTGMGKLSEVFEAVECIRATGNTNLIVLQCTTNYPSAIDDANLRAMLTIRDACGVRVGYSDHVDNNYACFASIALGAEVVEKHFTLDRNLPGPDHSSSLNPAEFAQLVDGIRQTERALGDGIKRPTQMEVKNSFGMKRSMVVLMDLEAGTMLSEEHIGFKRPANGLSPNMLDQVLGKKLAKAVKQDEALQYQTISW